MKNTKARVGVEGNEKVDEIAKRALKSNEKRKRQCQRKCV